MVLQSLSEPFADDSHRTHLSCFLERLSVLSELEHLLELTLFVNPSDLFAIVNCEKRLKRHLHDRAVCLTVFLADMCSDARARCDNQFLGDKISNVMLEVVRAAVSYYDPEIHTEDTMPTAISGLKSIGALPQLHLSFESRFRDWRQMMRAVRGIPSAHTIEESPHYGEVTPAILVADSVGNMLSHIRHMYCDRVFSDHRFCVD